MFLPPCSDVDLQLVDFVDVVHNCSSTLFSNWNYYKHSKKKVHSPYVLQFSLVMSQSLISTSSWLGLLSGQLLSSIWQCPVDFLHSLTSFSVEYVQYS